MVSFWEEVSGASSVVVVTGAGISCSSGLPVYRSQGKNTWDDKRLNDISRAKKYGNHLHELWDHWWDILEISRSSSPSPAHHALAEWENDLVARGGKFLLVTQNVDGLHQRAGSDNIVEVHGSLERSKCLRCKQCYDTPDKDVDKVIPTCPYCGKEDRSRADVVLFEEKISKRKTEIVESALKSSDLVVFIGTSGMVRPVRDYPVLAINADVVLVDPKPWVGIGKSSESVMRVFDHHYADFADDVLSPYKRII